MPHEIVSFDDEAIKGYVGKLVLSTVQETINALLDEEADQLVNAGRYERTDERQAYRSGHYKRRLVVSAGEVELSVPKLRGATFLAWVRSRQANKLGCIALCVRRDVPHNSCNACHSKVPQTKTGGEGGTTVVITSSEKGEDGQGHARLPHHGRTGTQGSTRHPQTWAT